MSLAKTYTVMCDNCGTWSGVHHETSRQARAEARRRGFERLPHPESMRKGYVADAAKIRNLMDYCKKCSAIVRHALEEIAKDERRKAQEDEREIAVAHHVYGTHS